MTDGGESVSFMQRIVKIGTDAMDAAGNALGAGTDDATKGKDGDEGEGDADDDVDATDGAVGEGAAGEKGPAVKLLDDDGAGPSASSRNRVHRASRTSVRAEEETTVDPGNVRLYGRGVVRAEQPRERDGCDASLRRDGGARSARSRTQAQEQAQGPTRVLARDRGAIAERRRSREGQAGGGARRDGRRSRRAHRPGAHQQDLAPPDDHGVT